MSAGIAHKQGKKNRKWGRFKLRCQRYSLERRYEKNKARKLRHHLRHHPDDGQALGWLSNHPQF